MDETQKKKWERSEIIQVVFLISIFVACACMVAGIVTIIKYSEMLKNPLGYNLKQFEINSCTCIDIHNRTLFVNALDYAPNIPKVSNLPYGMNITYNNDTNFSFDNVER